MLSYIFSFYRCNSTLSLFIAKKPLFRYIFYYKDPFFFSVTKGGIE